MSCDVHFTPRHVMSRHVILCQVMFMSRFVKSLHVMYGNLKKFNVL